MILETRAYLVFSVKVLGGNKCQGVGFKLWPTTVLVWEAKSSTCETKN